MLAGWNGQVTDTARKNQSGGSTSTVMLIMSAMKHHRCCLKPFCTCTSMKHACIMLCYNRCMHEKVQRLHQGSDVVCEAGLPVFVTTMCQLWKHHVHDLERWSTPLWSARVSQTGLGLLNVRACTVGDCNSDSGRHDLRPSEEVGRQGWATTYKNAWHSDCKDGWNLMETCIRPS